MGQSPDPSENKPIDLTGQCLIAMPGMGDERFSHSVVLMCSHSEEGAMGLIFNKATADVTMASLLEQVSLEARPEHHEQPVHFGGPVETGRGFVLHGRDYASPVSTLDVSTDLRMTATLDVLEAISKNEGPQQFLVCLGYSGWGAGQLEGELAQNAWLTCPSDAALVFETPVAQIWSTALERIGVPALALSAEAGRA